LGRRVMEVFEEGTGIPRDSYIDIIILAR